VLAACLQDKMAAFMARLAAAQQYKKTKDA
jgi:hypothetical protein